MKTQSPKKRTANRSQGSTLIVTLLMVVTLFTLAWAAFDFSFFTGRNATRINIRQQALAVGDSALEMLFAQFKDTITTYSTDPNRNYGDLCPNGAYFKAYLAGKAPTGAAFPELKNDYFPTVTNFSTANLTQAPTQVFTTYTIEPLDTQGRVAATGTAGPVVTNGKDGLKEGRAYRCLATVDVTLPTPTGQNVTAHLSRVFEYQVKSFLNYAIFAHSYLEIHPGPAMTINGPVHTNSTMYVGAGGGQVTFTDAVEGVKMTNPNNSNSPFDGIYAGRMRNSSPTVGPYNDPQHSDTYTTPNGSGWTYKNINAGSVTPLDVNPSQLIQSTSTTTTDAWGAVLPYDTNPNNDSYHEMIEPAVFPLTTNPDPLSPGDARTDPSQPFDYQHLATLRMSNIADYTITIDNSTHDIRQPAVVSITDGNGNTYGSTTDLYKAFVTGLTKNGTVLTKILTTTDSFNDAREADSNANATMQTTSVDVGALKAAVDAGAVTASADTGLGIIINDARPTKPYVAGVYTKNKQGQVTGTTSAPIQKTEPAIRLKNGYVMPTGGLTVVSQNPVYVQGDYNTGGSASNQPVSNSRTGTWPDPTKPDPTTVTNPNGWITYTDPITNQTNTYYWQPAAIVADAINVLSNRWSDANSGTSPTASATTINAAFLAGNVPTTNSNYSGGVENYPRFLENWTSVRFNYIGSMVILFPSQQATGPWKSSGVYSAPTRNWGYDKNFVNYGVPLLAAGGSGPGGMVGGGSRKTIAGGGAKMYFRKQWYSRTVQ